MNTHPSHRTYWVLLGILLALGLPHACQKDQPMEPTLGDELRLDRVEVDRTVLGPSDSTVVRAWVVRGTDPGTPVPGAVVAFSEMPDRGAGTFSKVEAATDLRGWVETVYRPTESAQGLVTLKVSAGASIRYVLLDVLPSTQASLSLETTTPDNQTGLPADGESELEISIQALDGPSRSPVVQLPLVLTAGDRFQDRNLNGIYDAGDVLIASGDRDNDGAWDPEGSLPERVTTDNLGRAEFRYRAGRTVGPVYLRITGGGTARELTLTQHSLELTVTVTTGARELLADGLASCAVTARVTDWADRPIGGVIVKFTAGEPFTDVDGDGFHTAGEPFEDRNDNGGWDAIGALASSATTSGAGTASAAYRAGTTAGPVSLRATTTGGWGQAVVELVAVPPARQVTIQLDRPALLADGVSTSGGQVEIGDANGLPLGGKVVTMVAGERFEDRDADGRFTSGVDLLVDDVDGNQAWTAIGSFPDEAVRDGAGRASCTYTAGRAAARVWVRAAVDGVTAEAPLDLTDVPPVANVELQAAYERMSVSGGGGVTTNLLTARCLHDSGDPVPAGIEVTFRIITGPGGGETLAGAVGGVVTARTDGDGRATTSLLAGTKAGWVQVRAASGALYRNASVYLESGPAAQLVCEADSSRLAIGADCEVRAWLYDAANNPVADGTIVRFRVDEGVIAGSEGGDEGRTIAGLARATFTATPPTSGSDGTAVIIASADGGLNGIVSCRTEIAVAAVSGSICRLTVVPSLAEIGVTQTGAPEHSMLSATAWDCLERPVGAGRRVRFEIVQGPGGGENLSGCACDTASALTDASGTASVTLNAGTKSGTVLIRAEAVGSTGVTAHTPVAIAAGPPHYLSVGVEECNVLSCGYVNHENKVVALVYDRYRNPVRDGTGVFFTTDHGMVEGNQGLGSSITERGIVNGNWRSGGDCGIVTITASTLGGSLEAQTSFIGSGDPWSATYVQPSASMASMYADGEGELKLRIQVLDINGLFTLPAEVEFSTIYGEVAGIEESDDGCSASIARAVYEAPVLVRDDSYTVPDDGIGAIDTVPVSAGFGPLGDVLQVRLLTGPASATRSSLDLESVPPNTQTYFTVTVKDGWGNPLGGHALSITASAGLVTPTGTTDSYGMAGGLSFMAPDSASTVLVEVRDLDPNYGGNLILRRSVSITN